MAKVKTGERRRATCRRCDASAENGAIISRAGLCLDCGIRAREELSRQLQLRKGPYWDAYVAGMRKSMGPDWEPPSLLAAPDA